MTVITEVRLDLRDIEYIGIECQACHARAVIPISTSGLIPTRCPGCNEDFDSNGLQNALFHFRKAYDAMIAISGKRQSITLHIAATGDDVQPARLKVRQ